MSKHYPEETLSKVRHELDICEVVETVFQDLAKTGIPLSGLKKKGGNYFTRCIFHSEKTPSLSFNPQKQIFHCFGCGEGGDVFSFVMKSLGLSFPESVRYLSRNYPKVEAIIRNSDPESVRDLKREEIEFDPDSPDRGIILEILSHTDNFFREQLERNRRDIGVKCRDYLKKRRLWGYRDIFGIGFCPDNDAFAFDLIDRTGINRHDLEYMLKKAGLVSENGFTLFHGRATFPVSTMKGDLIGYTARIVKESGEKNKYKNSTNGVLFSRRHILFGLNEISMIDVEKYGLVLVEGVTDKYGFIKQGMRNALSIGSTHLSNEHIGLIHHLGPRSVYLMTDSDVPGVQGAIRNANRMIATGRFSGAGEDGIPVYILPSLEGRDPFDMFFAEEIDARRYLREHAMDPKEFFMSRPDESLLKEGVNSTYSFLEEHCFHIVSEEEMKERFPAVKQMRKTVISLEQPPEFYV